MQKFASPEDQATARSYIDLLRQRSFESIEKATDPSIGVVSFHDALPKMAALFPSGEPTSVTLVGANRMDVGDASTVNLTFEYGFTGKWLLTNVAVKSAGGKATIVGFNVYPRSISLEEENRFTLSGKSPLQYLVLTFAIILPLLTLYALVVCVRTPFKGKKWPWILFIIVGVGRLAINWTTGQWQIAPVFIQLFSASAVAPFFGPWTLSISLPLGAVIFLLLRRKLSPSSAETSQLRTSGAGGG